MNQQDNVKIILILENIEDSLDLLDDFSLFTEDIKGLKDGLHSLLALGQKILLGK